MVDRGEGEAWTWGTPRMTGALKTFFTTSPDENMQTIFRKMTVRVSITLRNVVKLKTIPINIGKRLKFTHIIG